MLYVNLLFYRWENWESKELNNWFEATQVEAEGQNPI